MKIAFIKNQKLSKSNLVKLEEVNKIIADYKEQGFSLTLRQLYYQLVTKNIIANNDREYDKLSSLLTKGRMGGMVDWDGLADRLRVPRILYHNADVPNAIEEAANNYALDRQKGQKNYIELWVEKDALSNVLQVKTDYYVVRLMVNRGYSSTTAMFDAYSRIRLQLENGKDAHILYLGDHDPSGLDMVRDIYERLLVMLGNKYTRKFYNLASEHEDELYEKYQMDDRAKDDEGFFDNVRAYCLEHFKIQHIGLTTEQVKQYDPPPNPAKLSDPRAEWYISKFGPTSWEVDALNPTILHQLIDTAIESLIDMKLFLPIIEQEKVDIEELKKLITLKDDKAIVDKELNLKQIELDVAQLKFDKAKAALAAKPKKPTIKNLTALLKKVDDAVNL
jgi:hypothetical protein